MLEPSALGGYALAFSAIFMVGVIPANLVLVPIEVAVVELPTRQRLARVRDSLRLGGPIAVLAGLCAASWVLFAPPELDTATIQALTVTAVVVAIVSPLQDHVRRLLHTGEESLRAAIVSAVQLGVVTCTLWWGVGSDVPTAWLPLGALGLANVCSILVGLILMSSAPQSTRSRMKLGELARSGSWLVASAAISPATAFLASALVANLASSEALGLAEAARIVAQPVWVLAVGFSAVLAPKSVNAARLGDRTEARRVSRRFLLATGGLGVVSIVCFSSPWVGNVFYHLVPVAYSVGGLVFATLLYSLPRAWAFPFRSECLGAKKERSLLVIEGVGSIPRVAVSATAGVTGAFAIPLGFLAMAVVRLIGYVRAARAIYGPSSEEA